MRILQYHWEWNLCHPIIWDIHWIITLYPVGSKEPWLVTVQCKVWSIIFHFADHHHLKILIYLLLNWNRSDHDIMWRNLFQFPLWLKHGFMPKHCSHESDVNICWYIAMKIILVNDYLSYWNIWSLYNFGMIICWNNSFYKATVF